MLVGLTKRADFLAAARAYRAAQASFALQARKRPQDDDASVRVGYTCSKKVGNAVARNRAKRRLREAARSVLSKNARDGWDYVLIGRPGATADRPFLLLCEDLATALERVHSPRQARTKAAAR